MLSSIFFQGRVSFYFLYTIGLFGMTIVLIPALLKPSEKKSKKWECIVLWILVAVFVFFAIYALLSGKLIMPSKGGPIVPIIKENDPLYFYINLSHLFLFTLLILLLTLKAQKEATQA